MVSAETIELAEVVMLVLTKAALNNVIISYILFFDFQDVPDFFSSHLFTIVIVAQEFYETITKLFRLYKKD